MSKLKVLIDDKLLKDFKKRAYKLFGYKKGSIKTAVEIEIKDLIEQVDLTTSETEIE